MKLPHVVTTSDAFGPLVICLCCERALPLSNPARRAIVRPNALRDLADHVRAFRMLHSTCQWESAA